MTTLHERLPLINEGFAFKHAGERITNTEWNAVVETLTKAYNALAIDTDETTDTVLKVLATKSDVEHTHTIAGITGLQKELDSISTFAKSPVVVESTGAPSGVVTDVLTTKDGRTIQIERSAAYATKDYVDTVIKAINKFKYEVVDELPTVGDTFTIYLVAHQHGSNDSYDEYMYINNTYEKIGNTDIDLSGYATTTALETLSTFIQKSLATKADALSLTNLVSAGAQQEFTPLQQVQARANIDAVSSIEARRLVVDELTTSTVVQYAPQELSDSAKTQALLNLGVQIDTQGSTPHGLYTGQAVSNLVQSMLDTNLYFSPYRKREDFDYSDAARADMRSMLQVQGGVWEKIPLTDTEGNLVSALDLKDFVWTTLEGKRYEAFAIVVKQKNAIPDGNIFRSGIEISAYHDGNLLTNFYETNLFSQYESNRQSVIILDKDRGMWRHSVCNFNKQGNPVPFLNADNTDIPYVDKINISVINNVYTHGENNPEGNLMMELWGVKYHVYPYVFPNE